VGHIFTLAMVCGGLGIGCGFVLGNDDDNTDEVPPDDDGTDPGPGCALRVTSTRPAADEPGVEGEQPIIIDFSSPVDPDTISDATFAVTGPFGPVSGGYAVEGATVTFRPALPLFVLGQFSVSLTTDIGSDTEGCLADAFSMAFRVRDGDWSGRIDLAENVAEFLGMARNRRGDMVLPFTAAGIPGSIKAVLFSAAQRTFSLPQLLEEEAQSFATPRAAINEDGDAVVAWSYTDTPGNRAWVRRNDGAWSEPRMAAGAVGHLGLTSGGTAVMASDAVPGPATVIETLARAAETWSAPETAVESATVRGVLQTGDRVEIIAYDETDASLVARGYIEGGELVDAQHPSNDGVTVDEVNLQYLPGEDLVATWVQGGSEIWEASFDGESDTWTSAKLADGVLGSAVCANDVGARLVAYISNESIYAAHADPGEGFSEPHQFGAPSDLKYARCVIDELGNGLLIWADPGGVSFESRFADGVFSDAAVLGDGPTVIEAVLEPSTGHARVIFYNGDKLTARAFE
jgi:hypothetical protein